MRFVRDPRITAAGVEIFSRFESVAAAPEHDELFLSEKTGDRQKCAKCEASTPGIREIAALKICGCRDELGETVGIVVAKLPIRTREQAGKFTAKVDQAVEKNAEIYVVVGHVCRVMRRRRLSQLLPAAAACARGCSGCVASAR